MDENILAALMNQWEALFRAGQPLLFRKGQVFFYQGHHPCGLFVLREGRVDFSGDNCHREKEHQWDSPNGVALGLNPFFDDSPSCCTCTANENCQVIFISKTQLIPFLSIVPDDDHAL
jgi:cAMP-binding proteins - catabolite gene activator and regulatory subunit of cAMP-dependent protein kinases